MAQYDDSQNPFGSNPAPAGARHPWSDAAPKPDRGGLQLPGEQEGGWNGGQRPTAIARQRNQWRQHQQLTPDFGAAEPPAAPPSPPAAPRDKASLPTFKRGPLSRPPIAPSPRPVPTAAPPQRPPASPSGLQMHPHSFQPGPVTPPPPFPSAYELPPNVTPLRRRPAPPTQPSADPAAQAAVALVGEGERLPRARRAGSPRAAAVRGRLANPPLPLLYLIRLMIFGVGVAAIAGTLLSVLSPANVTSAGDGGTATPQSSGAAPRAALTQGSAATVDDLRLTSEITHLGAELEQLATLTPGLTPAAFALDLDSGQYVNLGGGEAVAAASTIKVPILVAFLQQVDAGTIPLNQAMVLQQEHIAGGSGTMQSEAVGTEYTALEVATRMIVDSDNTATNMIIAALGGLEALNQTFAGWGLGQTLLRNPLPDLEGTNMTSARDLALIMALVDQGGLLTPRSRDRLFSIMQRTENTSLIPSGIGDQSLTANKTGDIEAMLGDVAIVDVPNGRRYALAVLVQRPSNDGRASELIRRMTEKVHGEMAQPVAPVGSPSATPAPLSPPGEFEAPPATEGEFQPQGDLQIQGEPGIPVTPVPVEVLSPDSVPARDAVPPG